MSAVKIPFCKLRFFRVKQTRWESIKNKTDLENILSCDFFSKISFEAQSVWAKFNAVKYTLEDEEPQSRTLLKNE